MPREWVCYGWVALVVLFLGTGSVRAYDFSGGTGEPNDPYQIATAQQLCSIGSDPNLLDKHYVLMADITMSSLPPETPHEVSQQDQTVNLDLPYRVFDAPVISTFRGTMDGQGYSIKNLYIDARDTEAGFFGVLEDTAVIKNLVFEDAVIVGKDETGTLAGINYGVINDCNVVGAVVKVAYASHRESVGGLVGENYGSIHRCHDSGKIMGGFSPAGGLVGVNNRGKIDKSSAVCDFNAVNTSGGLVGLNDQGVIANSYAEGNLEGNDVSEVGGLVGRNFGGLIDACFASGNVVIPNGNSLGGLVGLNEGGQIVNSYATGNVNGEDAYALGGLVGKNSTGQIINTFASGDVSGGGGEGGLVGISLNDRFYLWAGSGYIRNSYARGNISGVEFIGGLVGIADETIVSHCYAIGRVLGEEYIGGLAGDWEGAELSQCFWDTETSGLSGGNGGVGLTTLEMLDPNTYLEAGWDLVGEQANGSGDVWMIPAEGGYPQLVSCSEVSSPVILPGHGTADDPYLIATPQDLGRMGLGDLSAHYRQVADINLVGITWSSAVVPVFDGFYDGNGYRIQGLNIEGDWWLGVFGILTERASVIRLGVTNAKVESLDSGRYLGILAGLNYGKVNQCWAQGEVAGGEQVGGLIGNSYGDVSNSYSRGQVMGLGGYVGGLVGLVSRKVRENPNKKAHLLNCYSAVAVSGEGDSVGGLVGAASSYLETTACFWDVDVSGQAASAAGNGLATAQMQDITTYLNAGWDFVGEATNGTEDIWIMPENSYPKLWWE